MYIWLEEYFKMVERWKAIVSKPISDDKKRGECLSLLSKHMERIALFHLRRSTPTLRFYAEMFELQRLLTPRSLDSLGRLDDLCRLAILPAQSFIYGWLMANAEDRSFSRFSNRLAKAGS